MRYDNRYYVACMIANEVKRLYSDKQNTSALPLYQKYKYIYTYALDLFRR